MEIVELSFTFLSVAISFLGSCWVLYYTITSLTYLRTSCLLSSLANLGLCSMNLLRVMNPTLLQNYFWVGYEAISALYATIIWTCLLFTGRKFYRDASWKDPLCKASILSLIILNIVHWVTAGLLLASSDGQPSLLVLILQAIFWIMCGICCFLYTFIPILTVHFNHVGLKARFVDEEIEIKRDGYKSDGYKSDNADSFDTSNTSEFPKYSINSQNASVGTWYMISVGTLTALYVAFYITTFIISTSAPVNPITNAVDFMLRNGYVIIYGVPPSRKLLEYMLNNVLRVGSAVSIRMSDMNTESA
ncbi:8943_t:CDS:2 [Acaulospora morrowiae]|uniref:8943_t:CDS:1 n=1 Tax=Acaulospora morrowiae TaxID=94023 RepID=A0A9N9GLQ7_9GLOM|nr:8943_t:CDS:2 [Acaulospora morrowiae]